VQWRFSDNYADPFGISSPAVPDDLRLNFAIRNAVIRHTTAGQRIFAVCHILSHVVGGLFQWNRGCAAIAYSSATTTAQRCGFTPVAASVTMAAPNAAHTERPVESIIPIAIAAKKLSPYVIPFATRPNVIVFGYLANWSSWRRSDANEQISYPCHSSPLIHGNRNNINGMPRST
jgi:hypothetical protein